MAFFAVTKEKLESVLPHPNADRLELGKLVGIDFQFVIPKGKYTAGDTVLYIPVDSLVPEAVLEKVGLLGKLSGPDKNRVRTIQLRGEYSQGIVEYPHVLLGDDWEKVEDITAALGITKFDPEPNVTKDAILLPIPDGVGVYDIEGAERYADVVEELMDQEVSISEKLEGYNFSGILDPDGTVIFCQHENRIQEIPNTPNLFCDVARAVGVPGMLATLRKVYPKGRIVLRGEVIGPGIRGNIYNLHEKTIRVFDIKVDTRYLNPNEFHRECTVCEAVPVPSLASKVTLRQWLAGKTLREASNGMSMINPKQLREGVVIKPMTEQRSARLNGRLFLKQRSPKYLAKEGD